MPVPIRDNGEPGPTRRLLVFVHGFCSSGETWDPLVELLSAKAEITNEFEIACFDYTTKFMARPVIERLPTVKEIAEWLELRLWQRFYDTRKEPKYIDVTLVGHSMGGLVIQQMLTQMLENGRGADCRFIRQAIFFATPHLGSITMEGLRGFLGNFVKNPQDEMLRGLNQDVAGLHGRMEYRVLRATRRETHRYPLPCTTFWGVEDNIVSEISARGFFPIAFPLPGNHTALHCPTAAAPETFDTFVSALLYPHGHSSIFEIDLFRYAATVRPLPAGTKREVRHGRKTRVVESDNEALVERAVTFGVHNNCVDDFELKYRTRNEGFIEPTVIPRVEMRPDHQSSYEESGVAVNYLPPPEQGKTYALRMKVLRGFEAGHRDYHQHFTNKCYFRRVRFELDLTAYLAAGWRVSDPPKLYYHPDDSDDHRLCELRDWRKPDPSDGVQGAGKWSWELEHIRFGVLDVKWDVAQ